MFDNSESGKNENMLKKISYTVSATGDGKTIHDILRQELELTEKQIRQAKYRKNGICLNGEQKYIVVTVKKDDLLEVSIEESGESKIPPCYDETWNVKQGILYEDEDLVVVNKPAGIVSHPSPGHFNDSMASILTGYYEKKNEKLHLRCIGRLDKDTSGVLLFAKNQVAADRLAKQRLTGELKKEYQALAMGHFHDASGVVSKGITKIPGEIQARIDDNGKDAITHYRVVGERCIVEDAEPRRKWVVSLVELHLDTGRTHQIRLHMSWMGHPLLGDEWYGGEESLCKRAALHASTLTFVQPFTKENIRIKAELPNDMKGIWKEVKEQLKREHHSHEFPPIYDGNSKILILGSFPSVKSREQKFYYGHPQNRFWKVLSKLLGCEVPNTIEEKKKMLIHNGIALWDVIESCDIIGSSDSSIRNVVVNDLQMVLEKANICQIYANGATAKKLYDKYAKTSIDREIIGLPSTSPANAAYSVERLVEHWKMIARYL